MIKTVVGDILDATEDIICHQVNCLGVMGAGVAKTLCTRWPIIKKTYIRYCRRFENQNELLGHVLPVAVEPNKTVLNIFGQLDYGRDKYHKYTDYVALTKAFDEIRSKYHNKSFAFPYGFGCGLANGDWNIVENMLNTYFGDMNVTIYRLSARSDEV